MKPHSLLLWAAGILTFTGCSSTPSAKTKVDTGPIPARTFSFVTRGSQSAPDFADKRQAIHLMIQDAITKNLAGRGVSKVDVSGDVTLAYLVIVGNNATTESIATYFGYGSDASALHSKAHEIYTNGKNRNYFEAGTLIIDIVDSRTSKLLKRGYATRSLLRNIPDDARAARLQEVVDEILRDVRIAP